MPKKLTEKEKMFVKEYLVDLNATQAAIRAGYSAKTAYSVGWVKLRKPEIREAIEKGTQERAKKAEISTDYILENQKKILEYSMEMVETDNGYRMRDVHAANRAVKQLGNFLGMERHVLIQDPNNPLFEPIQIMRAKKTYPIGSTTNFTITGQTNDI